ncbi:MFS transporter [Kitasatospora sp. NBC_01266]|uniref:MFS transporter n=1 Tax=Kitasatospora sp. NBC_01266 TaxID=2903572 RepID=UPI002E36748C|nr:MFS transporter [Kitasatospora sp. NBC_01266]
MDTRRRPRGRGNGRATGRGAAAGARPLLRSLDSPNFRLLAIGQLASNTGTWMQKVAQDWLVLKLSHGDGTALGITTALQFLPLLLLGPCGGVLVDRCPKRPILVAVQAALCVLALIPGFLAVTGTATLGSVYLLALVLGLTTVVEKPALQAFIAEAVPPADLLNALALNSTALNLARIAGPALAGPVIAAFGVGPAFFLNSVSYAVVLATLLLMDTAALRTPPAAARAKGLVRAGLRYVRADPDLGLTLTLVAFIGAFGMNFPITTALMATRVFHARAATFGLGATALAVGAVAGSLLAAHYGRCGPRYLAATALAFGLSETGASLTTSYPAFLLMLVPTGTALLLVMIAAKARIQLGVADEMRGRVTSLYMVASLGTTPLVAPLIGWISQEASPRAGLALGGIASAGAAMAIGLLYRRLPAVRPPLTSGALRPV